MLLNKFEVEFTKTQMGCAALGYTEREGRDRTEEMRFYAEFLRNQGYVVTEVSERPCFVRVQKDKEDTDG